MSDLDPCGAASSEKNEEERGSGYESFQVKEEPLGLLAGNANVVGPEAVFIGANGDDDNGFVSDGVLSKRRTDVFYLVVHERNFHCVLLWVGSKEIGKYPLNYAAT